jgi:hypothetical protein
VICQGVLAKKVGDFFEIGSESLIEWGLKIPRKYEKGKEEKDA